MNLQVQSPILQINNLPANKLQALIEQARELGTTPEEYALHLIVEGLEARDQSSNDSSASFQAQETAPKETLTPRVLTEWYGRREDAERFPDLAYWLSQNDAVRFDAAWEMVLEAHQIKGEDIRESRLQRTVGGLQRRAG